MSDLPSAAEVTVETQVLRTEAGIWDEQSHTLSTLSSTVSAMEFGRLEAGLFQGLVGPYNELIAAVTARTREGATAMTEIGQTLISAANTYDAEDKANEHRLRNIY
jgi:hypothetical protein